MLTIQKGEVAIGILTLDSQIGSASTSFANLVDTRFTFTIGDPLGGRILVYVDASKLRDGTASFEDYLKIGEWQSEGGSGALQGL